MSTTIVLPNQADLEAKVAPVCFVGTIKVSSSDDYTRIVAKRADAKRVLDEIDATFAPIQKQARATVDSLLSLRRKFEDPLRMSIVIIDTALDIYEREQEIKRKQAETRLAVEQEQQAKIEREVEVKHLAKTGFVAESRELAKTPVPALITPVLPSKVPRVDGLRKRSNWSAEVTDMKLLVKAVADGRAPLEVLLPNQAALNALARVGKSTTNIPGVKAVNNPIRSQKR